MTSRTFRRIIGSFFEYDTPKIVHIRSLKVGILYRTVQLIIIAYIIGVVMIYKKGYQETENVESTVTSKVKGVVMTNYTDTRTNTTVPRIWDTPDYVVPPQENGAFFITTNFVITPNQEQGICPEASVYNSCSNDLDCPASGPDSKSENGVHTGTCNTTTKTCNIRAWCPVEQEQVPSTPQLPGTEDFTVMIKNQIIFPKFNVRRRNIQESAYTNKSYLSSCRFDPLRDPYCPIYRLGDIVKMAGEDYAELAVDGAVLGIVIVWDCDLDYSVDKCLPKFTFRRIDRKDDAVSKGWNFRYANYWTDTVNGTSTERRTLVKAFGIRFIFYVYGTAGRFNFVPLGTNLGAGLALLGLSVVICDVILLYCTKRRAFYSDQKYLLVKDEDAFLIDESQRSNYAYSDYQAPA